MSSSSSGDDSNDNIHNNNDDDDDNVVGVGVDVGVDVENDVGDGIESTISFPLGHHSTFDEWEAAIVKSMSERLDDIFDIFEKYAEERRDDSEREMSLSWKDQQQSRDDDDDNDDNESPEGIVIRDVADTERERRKRLDEYKESYVAQLVEKLRLREVMASLTYVPLISVDKDAILTGSPTATKDELHDETNIQLLARLDAAEKECQQMAEQMKENERLHLEKVTSLEEEIKYWRSELKTHLERNVTESIDYQPDETEAEEASRMDDTQVMDDSPETSVGAGDVVTNSRGFNDSDQSTLRFEPTLLELESRNKEILQELTNCQISYEMSVYRNHELERDLMREQNAHRAEKKRCKKLSLLVTKAEHLLEVQGGKIKRLKQTQRKTRAICDLEIAKRELLERLNEKLKVAIEKIENKLKVAEYTGENIATLTTELERKDAIIAAIESILIYPTVK